MNGFSKHVTRRWLLTRASALGLAGAPLATLLSACGGGSSAPTTAATAASTTAPQASVPTPAKLNLASPQAVASPAAPSSPAAVAGTPKRGGTMVVLGHQEIASLSPDDWGVTIQWVIITQIHNGVLQLDEKFQLQPVLGEKIDVSPDGLGYTFHLRQGVKFHDGSDFSSADVKYTYDYYRDPKNATVSANTFQGIDSVTAPDASTVVVKMATPNATFLANVGTFFIVPATYHAQVGEKTYKTKPIGTGPFKLKEWNSADHTTVEAFDQHFRGRPYLDEFREDIVPEASVRMVALQTGKADYSVWPLLVNDSLKLATDPHFVTFVTPGIAMNHIALNNDRPQFADKAVRQAMLYAIDRQGLIKDVFKGTAVLATSDLSPAIEYYYEPNVQQYAFDPAKAKQLLDQAGWAPGPDGIRVKNGVRLSFSCSVLSGDQTRVPESEVIQQHLKDVGIEMQIKQEPVTVYLQGMLKGDHDAANFNWTYGGTNGDPDASNTLRSDGGSNYSHYKNPQMDSLLDQGLRETDPAKRKPIYSQIQKIVADDVPFLYLMHWNNYDAYAKRIQGLPQSVLWSGAILQMTHKLWIQQ